LLVNCLFVGKDHLMHLYNHNSPFIPTRYIEIIGCRVVYDTIITPSHNCVKHDSSQTPQFIYDSFIKVILTLYSVHSRKITNCVLTTKFDKL